MRVVALVPLLLLAASLAVPVQAQDASAPPLSPTDATLYAHHDSADTAELTGWMNPKQQDGDDNAMGPSASCGVEGAGLTGTPLDMLAETDIDRTYTLELKPALAGSVTLGATPAKATIHFGAGSCEGDVNIASTLKVGDTTIATGAVDHSYVAGAPYPVAAIDMPLTASAIAAGAKVTWVIHVTGTTLGAGYMGISDAQGRTKLELPVTGAAAALDELEFPVNVAITAATATDARHQYAFAAPGGGVRLQVRGNHTAGEALVLVRDGTTTLANNTFKGTTFTKDLTGPGNWSLDVRLTGFTGDVTVTLTSTGAAPGSTGSGTKAPGAAAGGSGSGTKSGSASGTSTSCAPANATGNATACGDEDGGKKDTPGPATPFVSAALLAAIALARRRR